MAAVANNVKDVYSKGDAIQGDLKEKAPVPDDGDDTYTLQPGADPVRKVTIVPRGRALGVTLSTPENDRYSHTEDYLRGRICGALGSIAAEQVVYGDVTTGAESDLEQVTAIARGMVGRWGMSERIGRLTAIPEDASQAYGLSAAPATLATLDVVDSEVRRIVAECCEKTVRTLIENRERLDALSAALMEHESLDEKDAYRVAGVPRQVSESNQRRPRRSDVPRSAAASD